MQPLEGLLAGVAQRVERDLVPGRLYAIHGVHVRAEEGAAGLDHQRAVRCRETHGRDRAAEHEVSLWLTVWLLKRSSGEKRKRRKRIHRSDRIEIGLTEQSSDAFWRESRLVDVLGVVTALPLV